MQLSTVPGRPLHLGLTFASLFRATLPEGKRTASESTTAAFDLLSVAAIVRLSIAGWGVGKKERASEKPVQIAAFPSPIPDLDARADVLHGLRRDQRMPSASMSLWNRREAAPVAFASIAGLLIVAAARSLFDPPKARLLRAPEPTEKEPYPWNLYEGGAYVASQTCVLPVPLADIGLLDSTLQTPYGKLR